MYKLLSLIGFALVACSSGAPSENGPQLRPENPAAITLRNDTDAPIAYVAAGERTLALLDIRERLAAGEYEDRRVEPRSARPVSSIVGYEAGYGVTFYLYRVDPSTGSARYSRAFAVSGPELARSDGVVTVDR
ncbi:MAG: hypothetical protein ACREMX_04520 [Gemmatimonadales bacterium]